MRVALLLAVPVLLSAQQSVGGYARELSTGKPLACFPVKLQDSTGVAVDSAETGRDGYFEVSLAAPGWYRLRFISQGLTDVVTEPFHIAPGQAYEAEFRVGFYLDSAWIDSLRSDLLPTERRDALVMMRGAGPRYPYALRNAGIEGDVIVLMTVDRRGRVDVSTSFPLFATHSLFLEEVLRSLPGLRYRVRPEAPECFVGVQPFFFRLERR